MSGCPKNAAPKENVDILDTIDGLRKVDVINIGKTTAAILLFPLTLSKGSLGSSALKSVPPS
jgi:hypothetical protein